MNIAPSTIQMCALFEPIFSFRLHLSQVTSFKKRLHMTCPVYLCDYIWVNGTGVPDHYCGEAILMLLPVCTLNFVLGNTRILFWKIYLDESLWCIVRVIHRECRSVQPPVICWLLALFLCSHVGGTWENGNDKLLVVQSSRILHSLLVS